MDIIFQGKQDGEQAIESLQSVIRLFKERYKIENFREMHLSVTLVDDRGDDVELVNSETQEVYRIFEVHRREVSEVRKPMRPHLKLVIDNSSS